jgi:major membrane immunogen (membrane-anchored lipoprotein)
MVALAVAASIVLAACSGSDQTDGTLPLGGINGPAVVDPSFDPFATDPSAPPVTGRD